MRYTIIILLAVFAVSCSPKLSIVDLDTGEKKELSKSEGKDLRKFQRKFKKLEDKYPQFINDTYGLIDTSFRVEGKKASFTLPDLERLNPRDTLEVNNISIIRLPGDTIEIIVPDTVVKVNVEYRTKNVLDPHFIEKDYTWWQKMFFWVGVASVLIFVIRLIIKNST